MLIYNALTVSSSRITFDINDLIYPNIGAMIRFELGIDVNVFQKQKVTPLKQNFRFLSPIHFPPSQFDIHINACQFPSFTIVIIFRRWAKSN
ncbi:hypothetical protein GYH30_006468 [Glycine max]|uniref:Uncharacterized protein n=1 Tax=Glycine max TaxID=3847 RepID=A0A0R0KFN9_SOYBN|nr:hypothetical protein GYH30_006468 [Glycine max]